MSGLESEVETGSGGKEMVRRVYDWSRVSPTTAVAETVAVAADRDVLAMEPLAGSVRVDALDDLFRADGSSDATFSVDTQLTVSYLGYRVTVRGDGMVVARPSEPST
jgi:hypothetical protein